MLMKLKQRKIKITWDKKLMTTYINILFLYSLSNSILKKLLFDSQKKKKIVGLEIYVKLYFIFTLIILPSPPSNIDS